MSVTINKKVIEKLTNQVMNLLNENRNRNIHLDIIRDIDLAINQLEVIVYEAGKLKSLFNDYENQEQPIDYSVRDFLRFTRKHLMTDSLTYNLVKRFLRLRHAKIKGIHLSNDTILYLEMILKNYSEKMI